MDICHLKNLELEKNHQKFQGRVVLRGDIVKDRRDIWVADIEELENLDGEHVLRTSTTIQDHPERGEELEYLRGESDGSQPLDSLSISENLSSSP